MTLERFRSSDNKSDNAQISNSRFESKKRPTNEMYTGNYGDGNLDPIPSESSPLHKKRREWGTSDSSAKFDWVPRKESETQDHRASNARIDGMRRNKEDIGRGIDMAGRVPARDRREYRLRSGWGDTESGSESEHESEGSGYVQGADTERETELEGQPVKLTSGKWDRLMRKLSKVESALQTLEYIKSGETSGTYDQRIIDQAAKEIVSSRREVTGDRLSKKIEKAADKRLASLRNAIDNHYTADTCHPDDNEILMSIKRSTDEENMEIRDIDFVCQQMEAGKRGAPDSDSEED